MFVKFVLLSEPPRGHGVVRVRELFVPPNGHVELTAVFPLHILPEVRCSLPHTPETLSRGRLEILKGPRTFDPCLKVLHSPGHSDRLPCRRPADLLPLLPLNPVPLLHGDPRSEPSQLIFKHFALQSKTLNSTCKYQKVDF